MSALIEIENLTIGYKNRGKVKVVQEGISGQLCAGELTCLLGPNGAGKSTLLKTLCGFLPSIDGNIYIDGRSLDSMPFEQLSKYIGVVLTEKPDIQNITVEGMVAYGRSPYTGFFGKLTDNDHRIIDEALDKVGIADMRSRLLQNLSDGERQKVMIAKALVQETPVIYLDEPAAFLDLPSKVELMQLLRNLASDTGKVIFISTHDLDLALQSADKIWLMSDDKKPVVGVPEDLIMNNAFKCIFERGGIYFDKRSGHFKIKNTYNKEVRLEGRGFEYDLLKRALSRNGIKVNNKDEAEEIITIVRDTAVSFVITAKNGKTEEYHSIEAVINSVK